MDPGSLPDRRDLHRPSQQVGGSCCRAFCVSVLVRFPPHSSATWACHVTLTALSLLCSFEDTGWRDVPTCVRTTSTRCNVTAAAAEDSVGCAWLRVRAERAGVLSKPVQACSQHGDWGWGWENTKFLEVGNISQKIKRRNTSYANSVKLTH